MSTALGNELTTLYRELTRELSAQGVTPVGYVAQRTTNSNTLATPNSMNGTAEFNAAAETQAPRPVSGTVDIQPRTPATTQPTQFKPQSEHKRKLDGLKRNSELPQEMDSLLQNFHFVAALAKDIPTSANGELKSVPSANVLDLSRTASTEVASPAPSKDEEVTTAKHTSAPTEPPLLTERVAVEPSACVSELVHHMLNSVGKDAPISESLQQLVHSFELPLDRLLQRDAAALTDPEHAAHRLLLAVIQRGRLFPDAQSPKFEKFATLVNETVRYLTALPLHDATAFEYMLCMWNRAWEKTTAQSVQARAATGSAEAFDELTRDIAALFSRLPAIENAPALWVDFLTGPWAYVAACAHRSRDQRRANRYLAIAPTLLWCVQPEIEAGDARRLLAWTSDLQNQIAEGLASIDYPSQKASPWLRSIARFHVDLSRVAYPETATPQASPSAKPSAHSPRNPHAALTEVDILLEPFKIGQWFELSFKNRRIHTQLSWMNDTRTSFMFTATNGSTQSMTLRMLEDLSIKDGLRSVDDTDCDPDSGHDREPRHSTL